MANKNALQPIEQGRMSRRGFLRLMAQAGIGFLGAACLPPTPDPEVGQLRAQIATLQAQVGSKTDVGSDSPTIIATETPSPEVATDKVIFDGEELPAGSVIFHSNRFDGKKDPYAVAYNSVDRTYRQLWFPQNPEAREAFDVAIVAQTGNYTLESSEARVWFNTKGNDSTAWEKGQLLANTQNIPNLNIPATENQGNEAWLAIKGNESAATGISLVPVEKYKPENVAFTLGGKEYYKDEVNGESRFFPSEYYPGGYNQFLIDQKTGQFKDDPYGFVYEVKPDGSMWIYQPALPPKEQRKAFSAPLILPAGQMIRIIKGAGVEIWQNTAGNDSTSFEKGTEVAFKGQNVLYVKLAPTKNAGNEAWVFIKADEAANDNGASFQFVRDDHTDY